MSNEAEQSRLKVYRSIIPLESEKQLNNASQQKQIKFNI
jgi:hypothetical protein